MITRREALGASAAAPFLTQAYIAEAAEAPPSIEALARPPALVGASLSPDGETIAVLREQRSADGRFAFVDLVRAADPKAKPARVTLGDIEVVGVNWANNERLLIALQRRSEETYTPTGSYLSYAYESVVRRMVSVGIDGQGMILLFADDRPINRTDPNLAVVLDRLENDPQNILMRAYHPANSAYGIYRMNVVTGAHELVEKGGPRTVSWDCQDGKAVLRLDATGRSSITLLARPPGQSEWKTVRKIRRETELSRPDFEIVGGTDEPGVFLAATRHADDATMQLRKFDLATGAVGAVVSGRPDRDVDGALIDGRGRFVAARYTVDRLDYDFADSALTPHFRAVDKFLRGEANARIIDCDRAHNRFLIYATGPRVGGAYYFYDRASRRMEPLGLARPWLSFDTLAAVETLDVRTRDGAQIRAYLTIPGSPGARPLVVMPHGGPEARDSFDFDVFAQTFAARGWLVLQPNFRGSGGYGRAFTEQGHRRWGDRMQEDVEDAISQVLASGRADPTKVAICGASYGGYAALMGAVRRPELYRCAVSIAGVSDLGDMLDYEREDGEDSLSYQYWTRAIGDPKGDAAMIRNASPRYRAAEIKSPVLLIHGGADRTVPIRQSRMMADALRKAGKSVEQVELREVGHRGWKPETLQSVLQQSADFITKNFA